LRSQQRAEINESGGGNDTVKAPDDYGGNGVVVKVADNQYALYAHMQTGSVIPKVGDEVKAGDPLGKLGNSGNSTVPHLHFRIQDTADAFGSNSVPYVFKAYTLTGTGTFSADGERADGDAGELAAAGGDLPADERHRRLRRVARRLR
jgi:murein DD-endopeptidase MepM/ murein hydrolase activator NlpD